MKRNKIDTVFLNLQSDYAFKRVFGTAKYRKALLKFLSVALGVSVRVTDVRFHDKEMLPSDQKGSGSSTTCTVR